jgi:hypothetical protein
MSDDQVFAKYLRALRARAADIGAALQALDGDARAAAAAMRRPDWAALLRRFGVVSQQLATLHGELVSTPSLNAPRELARQTVFQPLGGAFDVSQLRVRPLVELDDEKRSDVAQWRRRAAAAAAAAAADNEDNNEDDDDDVGNREDKDGDGSVAAPKTKRIDDDAAVLALEARLRAFNTEVAKLGDVTQRMCHALAKPQAADEVLVKLEASAAAASSVTQAQRRANDAFTREMLQPVMQGRHLR